MFKRTKFGPNSRRVIKKYSLSPGRWRKKVTIFSLLIITLNAAYFFGLDYLYEFDLHSYVTVAKSIFILIHFFAQIYFIKLFYHRLSSFKQSSPQGAMKALIIFLLAIFPLTFLIIFLKLYFQKSNNRWSFPKEFGIAFAISLIIAASLGHFSKKIHPQNPFKENPVLISTYYLFSPGVQFLIKNYKDSAFFNELSLPTNECSKSSDQVNCKHKKIVQRIRQDRLTSVEFPNAIALSTGLTIKYRNQRSSKSKSNFVKKNLKLNAINELINHRIEFLESVCTLTDAKSLSFPNAIYTFSGSLELAIIHGMNEYRSYKQTEHLINRIQTDLRRSKKLSKSLNTYNKFKLRFKKIKASNCIKSKLAFKELLNL